MPLKTQKIPVIAAMTSLRTMLAIIMKTLGKFSDAIDLILFAEGM